MEEQIEAFNEYLQIKGFAPKTIPGMVRTARNFCGWMDTENLEAETISYNDMMAYVKECTGKGNSRRTVACKLNSLRHFFDHLVASDQREANPVHRIRIKGIKRRILHDLLKPEELEEIFTTFEQPGIIGKRNKVILGLLVYQALRPEELGKLTPQDIKLREGKIHVPGSRRINGRELKLEAHQIIDLSDYMNETRKMFLAITGKQTDSLFTSMGQSERFSNMLQKMMDRLRKQFPKVQEVKQIRASVITQWLKQYNLRQTQYMAGHKYVSSTEAYQLNNLDGLKEEVKKFHPHG